MSLRSLVATSALLAVGLPASVEAACAPKTPGLATAFLTASIKTSAQNAGATPNARAVANAGDTLPEPS